MPTKKTTTKERERTEVTTYEEIHLSVEEVATAVAEKYGLEAEELRFANPLFAPSGESLLYVRREVDKEIQ